MGACVEKEKERKIDKQSSLYFVYSHKVVGVSVCTAAAACTKVEIKLKKKDVSTRSKFSIDDSLWFPFVFFPYKVYYIHVI